MDIFHPILKLVACDRGGRKVSLLGSVDVWKRASDLLLMSGRVAIVTGFMISETGSPETDGPSGSVVLGRSILRSGRECRIFTDPSCFDAVSACSESVGGPSVVCAAVPDDISSWRPDLVIFVERPGHAEDGAYYNMKGKDISSSVFPLDELLASEERTFSTIALGDGGNEAGMGTLSDGFSEVIPEFCRYTSSTMADVALPADVSNWGAYALSLVLSCLSGKWLGHSEREERIMLQALVDCGAVDGIDKKPLLSVDGFSVSEEKEILISLRSIYDSWTFAMRH